MNDYLEMTKKHADDIAAFPMAFAFNNEQFKTAMEKLGLTEKDTDQVCSIFGGGIIKKTDIQKYRDMFASHRKDMADAIAADKTGGDFILAMFEYELSNHEYGYTLDDGDTLEALGISYEDLEKSDPLKNGLKLAKNMCY